MVKVREKNTIEKVREKISEITIGTKKKSNKPIERNTQKNGYKPQFAKSNKNAAPQDDMRDIARDKSDKAAKSDNRMYFAAMGGLEHIGQNMYFYKYKGKYLIVDCGMGFLDDEIGAGDVQYCDTSWLEKHKKDIIGFVITHGHEDHLGALKYIWPKFRKPIYCTRFPGEIIRRTFRGMEIDFNDKKDIIIFDHNGATLDLAPFSVETFHVSHSIPEAQMLVIKTPVGKVLHTGDWTFNDGIPIEEPTDYARLREIGSDPKLLACMCDSTSSDRQSPQTMETEVRVTLKEIMEKAPGRVFVTGYSRSLGRIKMFAEAARASGRVACIKERSNPRPVPYVGLPEFREIGIEFGYLNKDDTYLHSEISDLPAAKQAIFLTGSQGEKFAMLTRLCRGHVKELKLQPTDTVVFSAIIIPGRESEVSFLYDKLAKLGIHTHTIFDTDKVHANGHAGRLEFERFYDIVHPQSIIPMHGDYISEMLNAKMAMERGGAKHMMIARNGEIVALEDGREPVVVDTFQVDMIVMEGETERSTSDQVYKNRKKIATSGAMFVTLPIDKKGFLKGVPEISSVGIFETDNTGAMKRQIQVEITKAIDAMSKAERKSHDNLITVVQFASNKVIRGAFGPDKKPQYSVHFVQK